ncbi:hypothetical protein E5345_11860 [Propionibacterium sp. NM47_B9-13]|uniref:Uncharacterized protein n=2 Tax=Cutibacterium modestum TaxID=2559073 RepID=A0AAD1NVA8_9ACTN|nr:hypothetical protein BCB70_12075 [Cutibacterium modestum]EFS74620.1 hypothetical protein HMPREF9621_00896 [Cutibacterium modestum HL037PA2]EFS93335.1 hypothetical protein HMPREF9607_00548 [Cutibacterium modestum HL044PA1]EFT15667.1 hypothetical protein HMPREF9622_01284 [Cutibacterium modestum HL037PA3]MCP2375526.1 hypothetical protein [Cutibacterium modestum 28N]MCP2379654.1 hypothetical protein [Cutibacterium modestum 30N]TGY27760.1 hypothetical protein E5345_11860 [Propionibacterium sp. 
MLVHARQRLGQPDDRSQAGFERIVSSTRLTSGPKGGDRGSQGRGVGVGGTVGPTLVKIGENAQRGAGGLIYV